MLSLKPLGVILYILFSTFQGVLHGPLLSLRQHRSRRNAGVIGVRVSVTISLKFLTVLVWGSSSMLCVRRLQPFSQSTLPTVDLPLHHAGGIELAVDDFSVTSLLSRLPLALSPVALDTAKSPPASHCAYCAYEFVPSL